MIRIIENPEGSNGIAKIMQDINKIDNPLTITDFRPILSDNDPVIGDKIIYIILVSK
jgi:hypothetical protein